MKSSTFAAMKIGIATGRMAAAVGGAQVPQLVHRNAGNARDAERIMARIRLGKRSIIFRIGLDAAERGEAIDELASIIADRRLKVPFPSEMLRCIAAAAFDEVAMEMCRTCKGATEIPTVAEVEGKQPMMPCFACGGTGRKRFKDDERIAALAAELVLVNGGEGSGVTVIAAGLRRNTSLRDMLWSIDVAKGVIFESERVAVEEAVKMLC